MSDSKLPTPQWSVILPFCTRAIVRTVIGFVGRHSIAVRQLPVDLRMKVWKRFAHVCVELPDTSLIGGGSGLGGVIHEIVREKFFENIEVAFALDLFGISADNGFCGFGRGDAVHFAKFVLLSCRLSDRPQRFRS